MAPGRKRGAKGAKAKSELSLGDLVLAKVKGFPAWPAKISRPEDWDRAPDPKKYFVQFYGTSEIAFVAPADIQAFTSETKTKLSARCLGKTVKYFAQAVKEICDEFEESQLKNLNGLRDDDGSQNLASESNSLDPVVDEGLEVSGSDGMNKEAVNSKLEIKGVIDVSVKEFSQSLGEMECQDRKPCTSDDVNDSPSPHKSSVKKNKISSNPGNQENSAASPLHRSHHVEEGSRDIKLESKYFDGAQNNLTNGHQPKLTKNTKKNPDGSIQRNSGSAISHVQKGEVTRRKITSSVNISADYSRSDAEFGIERNETKLLKQKKNTKATDETQADAELNLEKHMDSLPRKKMKAQHGHEKQNFLKTEASSPAKISKTFADSGDDSGVVKVQRKNNSRSFNVIHDKATDIEPKRLVLGGKTDNGRPFRVQTSTNESNHSSDEDDLPPSKRHRRALKAMSGSALTSESKLGSFGPHSDLVSPNKIVSPVVQLPTKRRAVLRCDDEDDELPKTPIHGGVTNKASATPSVSSTKKRPVTNYVLEKSVLRKPGTVSDDLKKQVQSSQVINKGLSPTAQQVLEKTGELSAAHVSPSPSQLDSEKLPSTEAKLVSVSPKLPLQSTDARAPAEVQNKQSNKGLGNSCPKKASAGANKHLAIASERSTSSVHQSITERTKSVASSGEKRKSTPKSNSLFNEPVLVVRNPDENSFSLGDRLDVGKNEKRSFSVDLKSSDSSVSMRNLIAAAQARKREAHILHPYGNPLPFLVPEADMPRQRTSPAVATLAFESSNVFQLEVQGLNPASPSSDVGPLSSVNQHENEEFEERRVSSGHQATGSSLSGGTEAAVARDAFEGMIETLSRTKESIGRATRLAIDCAKYGIANEVVELLIRKLENESSFHRRVDLFFLVDSITQCSHGQKGIAGASYIPIVQAALPRLIGAAAPPGSSAQENRRQCHKVLRLWLERKIYPDYVLRRYIDDIGVPSSDASAGLSFRRPSRAERAIDDPIREMEDMFVDEYGSNASFQLPGLLSSRIFEEEEEDEDDCPANLCNGVADASPSKQTPAASRDPENCTVTPSDRRHCILEDVDGELEMEDVSGHIKDERPLSVNGTFEHELNSDRILEPASNTYVELFPSPEGSPPLPPGSPPATPPLPSSPPPPRSFPSQFLPPPPLSQSYQFPPPPAGPPPPPNGAPPPPAGPPPPPAGPPPPPAGPPPPPSGPPPPLPPAPPASLLPHQSFHPQPAFMSQNMTSLTSTITISPASSYQPPAFVHEVGGNPSGNERTPVIPHNQGSHFTASGRSEVLPQQSSCFPPAGVGSVREQISYVPSRPSEYGQGDAYMNPQPSQHRHPFLPGGAPFAQRPLHPEPPPQRAPNLFSYPNSMQQHQYSSYSLPSFPDGTRRNAADEPWRIQVNEFAADCPRGGWMEGGSSAQSYSHEGYTGLHTERPAQNTAMFPPSAPNTLPAAPVPVHGAQMMSCRPDVSAINWRPP